MLFRRGRRPTQSPTKNFTENYQVVREAENQKYWWFLRACADCSFVLGENLPGLVCCWWCRQHTPSLTLCMCKKTTKNPHTNATHGGGSRRKTVMKTKSITCTHSVVGFAIHYIYAFSQWWGFRTWLLPCPMAAIHCSRRSCHPSGNERERPCGVYDLPLRGFFVVAVVFVVGCGRRRRCCCCCLLSVCGVLCVVGFVGRACGVVCCDMIFCCFVFRQRTDQRVAPQYC